MAQFISELNTGEFTHHIYRNGDSLWTGNDAYGKFLCLAKTTQAGTSIAGFNAVNGVNDIEIVTKFILQSDTGKQGILAARFSGNSEATTKGYQLSNSVINNTGTLAIDEGSTGYVKWATNDYHIGVMYWARFKIQGTKLWAKKWIDGQPEPGWQIEAENNVASTGAYSGIATYAKGGLRYYWLAFGTGGDPAPRMRSSTGYVSNANISYPLPPDHTPVGSYSGSFGGTIGFGGAFGMGALPSAQQIKTTYAANAFIEWIKSSSYKANACIDHVKSTTYKANATLDSYYFPANTTYKANARVERIEQSSYRANASLEAQQRATYITNAFIEWQKTLSYKANARIEHIEHITYIANAQIESSNANITYIANATILKIDGISYIANAAISNPVPEKQPAEWRKADEREPAEWRKADEREPAEWTPIYYD
jgi:hypothetical protein